METNQKHIKDGKIYALIMTAGYAPKSFTVYPAIESVSIATMKMSTQTKK